MNVQYHLTGTTAGVYLGLDKDSFVTTPQAQVIVTFAGFKGDRHAGITRKADSRTPQYTRGSEIRNDRQVSIVSAEELAKIATAMELPEIKPEWLGANLLLQGIHGMTQLPPMTRLSFDGGAVLVVQAENLPCQYPGKIIQDSYIRPGLQTLFPKAGMHLRGLVACVEKPGSIVQGDAVIIEVPEQTVYAPG